LKQNWLSKDETSHSLKVKPHNPLWEPGEERSACGTSNVIVTVDSWHECMIKIFHAVRMCEAGHSAGMEMQSHTLAWVMR
jgi:hypothetical protein